MSGSDIIFDSFGLYILGLVLLFGSYDIFLRIRYGQRQGSIRGKGGLIFCLVFLLVMGSVLFVLSLLFLARLYAGSKAWFYSGAIIFVVVAGVTFQIMKWKRQILKEDMSEDVESGSGMSEPADRAKGK
ncbi:MAG: hypothetical protein AB1847_15085 [bacterium]